MIALNVIRAFRSDDVFDLRNRQAMRVAAAEQGQMHRTRPAKDQRIHIRTADDRVVAPEIHNTVAALAAVHHVIAEIPRQRVIANPTKDCVMSTAAPDLIIACPGIDPIIVQPSRNQITRCRAHKGPPHIGGTLVPVHHCGSALGHSPRRNGILRVSIACAGTAVVERQQGKRRSPRPTCPIRGQKMRLLLAGIGTAIASHINPRALERIENMPASGCLDRQPLLQGRTGIVMISVMLQNLDLTWKR